MNKIFGLEIKKALKSKGFIISVLAGCIISILQSIWYIRKIVTFNNREYLYVTDADIYNKMHGQWFEKTIIEGWLGCEVFSEYNQLFYMIFPILATMPFAASLYREFKSGYISQMITRCGRKKYFTAKYIAVFLGGGLAVSIPLLINLVTTACYLPAAPPDPLAMQTIVTQTDLWAELYFEQPVMYALLYTFVDFLYGGLFAVMALASTFVFNNTFSILSFPFIVCYCLIYGMNSIARSLSGYNMAMIIKPTQSSGGNTAMTFAVTTLAVSALTMASYYVAVRKRDIRKEH